MDFSVLKIAPQITNQFQSIFKKSNKEMKEESYYPGGA